MNKTNQPTSELHSEAEGLIKKVAQDLRRGWTRNAIDDAERLVGVLYKLSEEQL